MLFDLQGKRRRFVQGTYLILAILMGGGLVLFGVGSGNISGGLFDAITGKDSNSSSINSTVTNRIKRDQNALKLNPRNQVALADLVRSHYQLATEDADANTGAFGADGKKELEKASSAWQRYVDVVDKPSDAAKAAQLVASAQPSAQAYLTLTAYAAKAGDTRTAELAGQKAIELAPKAQKKLVKQQVAAVKAQGTIGPNNVTPQSGSG